MRKQNLFTNKEESMLKCAFCAVFLTNMNMPVLPAVLLCLTIGALSGAWQGFWIAFVKIPSVVVTLIDLILFGFAARQIIQYNSNMEFQTDE